MMRSLIAILAVLTFVLPTACRQETEPPPQYNRAMTAGGKGMMPLRVPASSRDKSILSAAGPATAEPAAKAEKPAAAEGGEIVIDNSSAKAAVETFGKIMESGKLSMLGEILVEEQSEAAYQVFGAVEAMATASGDLKAALDESFPNHAIKLSLLRGNVRSVGGQIASLTIVKIEELAENKADATVKLTLADGKEKEIMLPLEKVDDNWFIQLPEFNVPEDITVESKPFEAITAAMQDITDRIKSKDLADEEATKAELQKAMDGFMQNMPLIMRWAAGDAPSEDKAPKPAPANKPREREQVDEVYSDPGMLRGR